MAQQQQQVLHPPVMADWRQRASKHSDIREMGGVYWGVDQAWQFVPPFCANGDAQQQAMKLSTLLSDKELGLWPRLPPTFWDMRPYEQVQAVRTFLKSTYRTIADLSLTERSAIACLMRVLREPIDGDPRALWREEAGRAQTLRELFAPLDHLLTREVYDKVEQKVVNARQKPNTSLRAWLAYLLEVARPFISTHYEEWEVVRDLFIARLDTSWLARSQMLYTTLNEFALMHVASRNLTQEQKSAITIDALKLLLARASNARLLELDDKMSEGDGKDGRNKDKRRRGGGNGGDRPADRNDHKDGSSKGGKDRVSVKRDRDGDKVARKKKEDSNKRGRPEEQPLGPPVGEAKDWPLGWIQRITDKAEFNEFVRDKTCNKCGEKGHLANAPHLNGTFVEKAAKPQWKRKEKQSVRFAGAKADRAASDKGDRLVDAREWNREKEKLRAFMAQMDEKVAATSHTYDDRSTADDIIDAFKDRLYMYDAGGSLTPQRVTEYAAFAARLGEAEKGKRLAQLVDGIVPEGTELSEREVKSTWKAMLVTMGADNHFAIVLLDSGAMGSSVITPKQCEALGIEWKETQKSALTGIGEASVIGRTGPVPVTLADKTGEITFLVTTASLLYPLIITGDFVPVWGEPQFSQDLKAVLVGNMRYVRSMDSVFVPLQLTVGSEEASAADSVMEDGGNPALLLMRKNTLGDDEIVANSVRDMQSGVQETGEASDGTTPPVYLHRLKVEPVKPLAVTSWPENEPTRDDARGIVVKCARSRDWPMTTSFQFALDHGTLQDLHLVWQLMWEQWQNETRFSQGVHPVMLDRDLKECVADPPHPFDDDHKDIARAHHRSAVKEMAVTKAVEGGLQFGVMSVVPPGEPVRHLQNLVFAPTHGKEYRVCIHPEATNAAMDTPADLATGEMYHFEGITANDLFFMLGADVRKAFWTVQLASWWQHVMTFRTRTGLVRWNRMPFGPSWAPSEYNRFITDVLRDHNFTGSMRRQVDNILIFGRRDDMTGFLQRTVEFARVCNRHRVPLSNKDWHFMPDELTFNGRQLTRLGTIEATTISLDKVLDASAPYEGASQVRTTLGFAEWVANYNLGMKATLKPFRDLLKPGVDFAVAYDHKVYEHHWRNVQRALSLTLVRRRFVDPSLPAALLADASEKAMMVGALLLQPNRDTEDPIADPPEFWWIVNVLQKQLNRYQRSWAVIVKELYSVVTGIAEFRETMQVCKRRFVLSDHMPLKHLARTKLWGKLSPVQQRLMTVILSLHAKWLYSPGPKTQIADVVSRWRLVHKPEGSQLIPVLMRTGEELQPGNGLTAPLMDRIELGEPLHPVRQEREGQTDHRD